MAEAHFNSGPLDGQIWAVEDRWVSWGEIEVAIPQPLGLVYSTSTNIESLTVKTGTYRIRLDSGGSPVPYSLTAVEFDYRGENNR